MSNNMPAKQAFTLSSARVIDPNKRSDSIANVHIQGHKLTSEAADNATKINAEGLIASPGFIDLYARLREPGFTRKGTIASESLAARSNGFTTVLCAPDTEPTIDSTTTVELIRQRSNAANGAKVIPIAALTAGLGGSRLSELATLFNAGCIVASNADHPMTHNSVLLSAMQYAASFDIPLIMTPLDSSIASNGCAHAGAIATKLGLPSIPVVAETAALASLLELCRSSQCRLHVSRLSSARAVDMVRRAKSDGLPVTADVGINHLFFTDRQLIGFDAHFHSAVPFRSIEDREALRSGVADGTIDAICSDHSPQDADAKLAPFPSSGRGLSTFDVFLPLLLALPDLLNTSLNSILEKVTSGPARVISKQDSQSPLTYPTGSISTASLQPGALADVILIDPEVPVNVNINQFISSGQNTPLHGLSNLFDCTGEDIPLKGSVVQSFIDGIIDQNQLDLSDSK